jgi:fatty acid desaturase
MHDGNHSAFSSNKTLSLIAGYVLDLTFSTSVVYRRSHNFGHHGIYFFIFIIVLFQIIKDV